MKYFIIILIFASIVLPILFININPSDEILEAQNHYKKKQDNSNTKEGGFVSGFTKPYIAHIPNEQAYNTHSDGYEWAEENNIKDFSDCNNEYNAGTKAEDGCNEYVQENSYYTNPTFGGYGCTEDCGGHEAGYDWAEEKGIDDPDDCGGNSNSFIEGCMSYAEGY
ncbi:MAG: hypothetical protein KAI16_00785 [Candidatus Pacebacteria bacterium]|nr:hypothetical protein [Candidatus Paceibacterota bacterium]